MWCPVVGVMACSHCFWDLSVSFAIVQCKMLSICINSHIDVQVLYLNFKHGRLMIVLYNCYLDTFCELIIRFSFGRVK